MAQELELGFVDTDVLIEISHQNSLQEILDQHGYLHFRALEEAEILKIDVDHHVISTGGSVIYGEQAMQHLKSMSQVIFLEVEFEELQQRIDNFHSRGITLAPEQTFRDLFDEREPLYRHYADLIISSSHISPEEVVAILKRSPTCRHV